MNRNPYLIVKEFVDSPSEQARKNAITALAVLADPEGLKDLVRLALNDPAPPVRERAEREVAALPSERLSAALDMLHERICARGDDQYRAYALLGRLRSQGVPIERPRVSLLRRIRLAKQALEGAHLSRRSSVLRSLWASLRGAIGGSIVFMLLIGGVFSLGVKSGDAVGYSLASVLVGVVVAMGAVSLSVPLGVQADPLAAVLVDFGMLLVVSVSAAFLSSLLLTGADTQPPAVWCVYLMFTLTAIAIRAAMLLAIGSRRSHTYTLWIGISCGTSAGVLVVSAVPALLHQAANGSIGSFWVVAVPVVAAVATAFAVVDSQAPTQPLVPVFLRVAGFVPLILVVAAVVWVILGSPRVTTYPNVADGGAIDESHSVEITSVPAAFTFSTRQQEKAEFSLVCPKSTGSYTYTIRNKDGLAEFTGMDDAHQARPNIFFPFFTFSAGDHHMLIWASSSPVDNVNMEAVLPTIGGRLLHGGSNSTRQSAPVCTVQLAFNVAKP